MKAKPNVTISNNTFESKTEVVFDANSIKAVQTIAEALLNLSQIFVAQGINVTMLNIADYQKDENEKQ